MFFTSAEGSGSVAGGGAARNRTGVLSFAGWCVTTPPRHPEKNSSILSACRQALVFDEARSAYRIVVTIVEGPIQSFAGRNPNSIQRAKACGNVVLGPLCNGEYEQAHTLMRKCPGQNANLLK